MIAAARLIRTARREAGLTQAELAERMGTAQSVVARLESTASNPRLATLNRALAAAGREGYAELRLASHLDESMIRANMKLEPIQRLRAFAAAYVSLSGLASKAVR